MKYEINKSNYHTFGIYEVNKLAPRSYFIPYPNREKADKVSLNEKRYKSPKVVCLNGDWDFKFYPLPFSLPDVLDTDEVGFDTIDVPSCIQFRGYDRPFYVNVRYQFPYNPPKIPKEEAVGKVFTWMNENGARPGFTTPKNEYNFVGVYRKNFKVTAPTKSHVLSFLGVASCMDLYVNGQFVGYSEGSHNTAEFEIKDFIKKGENEILVVVRRWCNGTYLECQDMFRNTGIFRDVLLRINEKTDIRDINFKQIKNEDGTYDLKLGATTYSDCEVKFTLEGHDLSVSDSTKAQDEKALCKFAGLKVCEWNSDYPTLYNLYVETDTACVKVRVGFKNVVIDGDRLLINDTLVKFHGVNHHDTSAQNGYTLSPAEIERDMRLCKEYNIDTVRTSHYPPDPLLLEYCDELGIYVVDEADMETHGVFAHKLPASYNRISNNPDWERYYYDRARRLYQRDKLHTSIVMWSLGNEAGGTYCTDVMYDYLKKRTDLPIHYESAIHTKKIAYDVGSEMYPSVEKVHLVGEHKRKEAPLNDRPYFLCEYVHAMGVGPGNMEGYWQEFYNYENLCGGCVWEMVDHAVLHEDGSYTYGGDHGEWEHDGNFCCDGIFYPDRTPSTGAKIVKFVYRPIRVSHILEDEFEIFNTRAFSDGSRYKLIFNFNDGKNTIKETEITPDTAPFSKENIRVEIPENKDGELFLNVETIDLVTKTKVSTEQIEIKRKIKGETISLNEEKESLSMEFKKDIIKFSLGDVSMETSNPYTILFRAPTDNDKIISGGNQVGDFLENKEEIISETEEDGKIKRVFRIKNKKNSFICTDIYEYTPEGILVSSTLICEKGKGSIPRFGKAFRLPETFDEVKYFGRNGESYLDMKDHTQIEEVSCKVSDMTENNIKPQESGNRCDCRYVELSSGDRKISFTAVDRPFELCVKPYSDRELISMRHREDEIKTGTYVTIQAFQMGIGTGSCGPATEEEHKYPVNMEYTLKFIIS